MKYDAGVFTKNGKREVSSIYRFLTRNPPRIDSWPKHILKDFGVLIMTPGVSWRWIKHNFDMTDDKLVRIRKYASKWEHLAVPNMISATHEDAYLYRQYALPKMGIPVWAMPFILDDIKNGMKPAELRKKWNLHPATIYRMKKGVIGNVFHSSAVYGRGKNLGRSV